MSVGSGGGAPVRPFTPDLIPLEITEADLAEIRFRLYACPDKKCEACAPIRPVIAYLDLIQAQHDARKDPDYEVISVGDLL